MKTVGIVAEYNPFHNGHKYQIEYAKKVLKADYVIIAMSGNFTQRGTIAILDKYHRAECALRNGADIVFEIPTIFSTSSAREFATASTILLSMTGLVNTILFGAETNDISLFQNAADLLIEAESSIEFNNIIKEELSAGSTYAAARAAYFNNKIPEEIITNPNNILGLEYCYSIRKNNLKMEPCCLKRVGNDYNSNELSKIYSSATAIRTSIENADSISIITDHIPASTAKIIKESCPLFDDDVSDYLHYKIVTESDFSIYLDCNRDISDRINKLKYQFKSFSQFAELLKTKNITLTRANRILCHILLDIKSEHFNKQKELGYINYLRMLGFSSNGAGLLSSLKESAKVPVITKPTDLIDKTDIMAADIYNALLQRKTGTIYPNEYNRKFDLKNIKGL